MGPSSPTSAISGLARHLASTHSVDIAELVQLDVGVFRVDHRDRRRWVARVFPDRAVREVDGDAAILRSLATAGFPAERCAVDSPVSEHEGTPVLVTDWVPGERSNGRGRTFGVLGALLGVLHARDGGTQRAGGAWHHLSPRGGPRAEIDAAIDLLEGAEPRISPADHARYDRVRDELAHLDDCHDLPQAFVHPDFVPANAITTPDDARVIVDWTGCGVGPRLWSLAFLLWAGGVRDLRLVDAAMTRYLRHVSLDGDELTRLAAVIPARPLTMDVWAFCHGRRELGDVLTHLAMNRAAAQRISARVAALLEH